MKRNGVQVGSVTMFPGANVFRDRELAAIRMQAVGLAVRALRKQRGMSQTLLAERSGWLRPTISDIERGKKSLSFDRWFALAWALNVSLSELVFISQQVLMILSGAECINGAMLQAIVNEAAQRSGPNA